MLIKEYNQGVETNLKDFYISGRDLYIMSLLN